MHLSSQFQHSLYLCHFHRWTSLTDIVSTISSEDMLQSHNLPLCLAMMTVEPGYISLKRSMNFFSHVISLLYDFLFMRCSLFVQVSKPMCSSQHEKCYWCQVNMLLECALICIVLFIFWNRFLSGGLWWLLNYWKIKQMPVFIMLYNALL